MPIRQGSGAVPSDKELTERLYARRLADRLIITPLLDPEIHGGGIDIRLGTKFITGKRTEYTSFSPLDVGAEQALSMQRRSQIAFEGEFVLHPDQLALASSLEYMCLPRDLAASVVTRSTFGRAGLLGATAVFVHPGFRGCLTLELLNLGEVPIVLQPGMRVAQLVFLTRGGSDEPRAGKYCMATEPEFPKFWGDRDRAVLRRIRDLRSKGREREAGESPTPREGRRP
jgi:deoxycytidine triphosphate deaminase